MSNMSIIDKISGYLRDNDIEFNLLRSCYGIIYIINGMLISLENNPKDNAIICIDIFSTDNFILAEKLIYSLEIDPFTYNIYIGETVKFENLDLMPLYPYVFRYDNKIEDHNIRNLNITTFIRNYNTDIKSIIRSPREIISYNFNKKFPVILNCHGLKNLDEISNIINIHPIILINCNFGLNGLIENNNILGSITFIPGKEELFIHTSDGIILSDKTGVIKLINNNKIRPAIKAAK